MISAMIWGWVNFETMIQAWMVLRSMRLGWAGKMRLRSSWLSHTLDPEIPFILAFTRSASTVLEDPDPPE